MYNFVDITEVADVTSHSIKTIFDDINLDSELTDNQGKFQTLSVTGRAILNREIISYEIGKHGAKEKNYKLEPRLIEVRFLIEDNSNEGFRSRFERLNGFLLGGSRMLEFTDENAFFIATLQSYDNPEENTNSMIGVMEFICNDPFKYYPEKSIQATGTHDIKGHTSTTWKTKTVFTSNQTGYELQFNSLGKTALRDINKIVINYNFIVGDILEIDYSKRRITVNGNDISNALVIIQSNYAELPNDIVRFEASHETDVFYRERYY